MSMQTQNLFVVRNCIAHILSLKTYYIIKNRVWWASEYDFAKMLLTFSEMPAAFVSPMTASLFWEAASVEDKLAV
jgi:hypothetical protein